MQRGREGVAGMINGSWFSGSNEAAAKYMGCSSLVGRCRSPRRHAPGAPGPCTVISMRRFFARFAGVSFGATECVSPNPFAELMFGLTPCETRQVTTSPARPDDNDRLSLIPAH